jgi:GT2 family glycosyltransferase
MVADIQVKMSNTRYTLGVVIVTYNAADVIRDCLETLLAAAEDVALSVVVVDNASPDATVEGIKAWAAGKDGYTLPADLPFHTTPLPKPVPRTRQNGDVGGFLHVIRNDINGGFAAGVNVGLTYLAKDPKITRFWILNPDCAVPPGTPKAFATYDPGCFSLMGGRMTYYDTDSRWTGGTKNFNFSRSALNTRPPDPANIDFISGGSMVASRAFYEAAGPMSEDYFLFYEEVDWAMRRGDLPLAICDAARVYHKAGTSTGSPTHRRAASPFSLYFKHRAWMRFVRRHQPASVPLAWAYALAKAGLYWLKGWKPEARAILDGARGGKPSEEILGRLSTQVMCQIQ